MTLYLRERIPHVTTLGPGLRYGVWVQGCRKRCPGCISPSSRPMEEGTPIDPAVLGTLILASGDEGITISGGEPFEQSAALAEMLRTVRREADPGVIVYTGYTYEALLQKQEEDRDIASLLRLTDLLIDGPYLRELDDGLSLRGSSNQRVIPLTDRYRGALSLYGAAEREIQVVHRPHRDMRIGIPVHQK